MSGSAPRAREDSVRSRRLFGASARPLNFTVRAHMERPSGVGALAKILALLGVVALLSITFVPWRLPLVIAPEFLPLGEMATRWALFGSLTLYCLTSLVCAFALWRLRPFALCAYYAFAGSLMLYFVVFLFLIRVPKPLGIGVLFFALVGAGLYCGWRIAQKASGAAVSAL